MTKANGPDSHHDPRLPEEEYWRPLLLFLSYRVLVAVALLLLFLDDLGPSFLGQTDPRLYTIVTVVYLGLTLAAIPLYATRAFNLQIQTRLMLAIDVACITLLLFASGGIDSGLGTLLAVSIAVGNLIVPGGHALLMASFATLAVLAQQGVHNLGTSHPVEGIPQAGLLGASFFAIATLAHVLSRQLHRSQQLISQQRLDLANLAQLNEYVIQHMQTGILVVDRDDRIRLINEAAWYLLGMPDAQRGQPLRRAVPTLADQLANWRRDPSRQPPPFHPTPRGRELKAGFSQLGNDSRDGVVIFLEDAASITQQAQQIKLASLGRLTASIAHEIRNPLGAIGHAGQLLAESPDLDDGDRRLVEIVTGNTGRVNQIIENVLQLSRRRQSAPEEFAIRPWLEQFVDDFIMRHALRPAQVRLRIDPADTMIFADPGQLRQVLDNLCDNAVQHFDHRPSELRLVIEGGITRASGGPYLELSDNGPGIPEQERRRVFEPFFTTNSSGTGLGLYIARELCESNRIRLEYLPGETGGSRFRMNFPAVRNIEWKQT